MASSLPKISVILPVYNGQRYLRECIESVLGQMLTDFELLIGDDCSKDESGAILDGITDPRVRVTHNTRNQGLFANVNQLVGKAQGSLVHFLCQDDRLEKECLERVVAFFEKHNEVAMSICPATVRTDSGVVLGQWEASGTPQIADSATSLQMLLYYGCIAGNLSTVCVRRSVMQEVGGFDESFRLAADYDLWVRICARAPMANLQQHLVVLTDHSERLSRSHRAGAIFVEENRRVREKLLALFPRSVQPYAKRFVLMRQNVLDTHELMSALAHGRFRDALQVMGELGPRDMIAGTIAWLLTVNNHLFCPKPDFARWQ